MLKKIAILLASCALLSFSSMAQAADYQTPQLIQRCKDQGYSVYSQDMDPWDVALWDYLEDQTDWGNNPSGEELHLCTTEFNIGEKDDSLATKRIIVFLPKRAILDVLGEFFVTNNGEIAIIENGKRQVVRKGDKKNIEKFAESSRGFIITRLESIPENGDFFLKAYKHKYRYEMKRIHGKQADGVEKEVKKRFFRDFEAGYNVVVSDENDAWVDTMIVDDGVHNIYRATEDGWRHIYSDEPVG